MSKLSFCLSFSSEPTGVDPSATDEQVTRAESDRDKGDRKACKRHSVLEKPKRQFQVCGLVTPERRQIARRQSNKIDRCQHPHHSQPSRSSPPCQVLFSLLHLAPRPLGCRRLTSSPDHRC